MKIKVHGLCRDSARISDMFRKRRFKFYGHILRMKNDRLTKRFSSLLLSMKANDNWLIESDLQEIRVTREIVQDRFTYGTLVHKQQFTNRHKIWSNTTWTEELRKDEQMMKRKGEEILGEKERKQISWISKSCSLVGHNKKSNN